MFDPFRVGHSSWFAPWALPTAINFHTFGVRTKLIYTSLFELCPLHLVLLSFEPVLVAPVV